MDARRAGWAGLTLILVVTAWVYREIPGHALVWDDWTNFGSDRGWESPGLEKVRFAFSEVRLGHYQPLAWLSLSLDHALYGPEIGRYRLTNLALHLANTIFVYLLGLRLFRRLGPAETPRVFLAAAIAAAVFALHPMRVETVAWLTERRHLLAAFFALVATLAYLRAADGARRCLWLVPLAYAASLLSTPLAYSLPLVLILLDVHPLGRSPSLHPRDLHLVEKIPLLSLMAGFTWTALGAQAHSGALIAVDSYTPWQRIAQAGYSAAFYPRALFSWVWLPLYERPSGLDPGEGRFVVSILAAVAVSVLVLRWARTRPAPAVAWFAYLLLLAPVSGLAQSGSQLVADRYSYLATLSVTLLFAGAAVNLSRRFGPAVSVGGLVAVGLLVLLWTGLTQRQVRVWRDDRALWSHSVSHRPSGIGHNNLATLADREGDLSEAVHQATRAIRAAPTYGRAWMTARSLLESSGEPDPGRWRDLAAAIESGLPTQTSGTARYIAGLAAARAGDLPHAISRFEQAVEIHDALQPAWLRLGIAYGVAGREADARRALARAVALAPKDPVALEWLRRVGGDAPS